MRIGLLSFFVIALAVASPAAADSQPALIDVQWTETFERGEIAGWSSYPPFEDTGYDYTLLAGHYRPISRLAGFVASGEYFLPAELPPPDHSEPNSYYLVRSYRPNSVSPQSVGVSRRLMLYSAKNARLAFDYYFEGAAQDVALDIHLAGGDGRRYTHRIPGPAIGHWTRLDIPIESFQAEGHHPPPEMAIEALAIVAEMGHGNPGRYIFFAVDNVSLSARRMAGFAVDKPAARAYDHWRPQFAESILHPGDKIDIAARADIRITEATATLLDPDNKPVAGPAALSFDGGRWSLPRFHVVRGADPRGPWTLVVKGLTADGRRIGSELRLWVMNRVEPGRHPRVLFGPEDLAGLREKIKSKDGRLIWNKIIEAARKARETPLPKHDQLSEYPSEYLLQRREGYGTLTRVLARDIFFNALVFAIAGDAEAGTYARRGLLFQAGLHQWIHPAFAGQKHKTYLYVAHTAYYSGLTYDLVYELMSEDERRAVRRGILDKGIEAGFEQSFVSNCVPSHTSNHIAWETAAPISGLLAFLGDMDSDPPGSTPPGLLLAGLAEKALAHVKAVMMPDGGWGEEYSYQRYAAEAIRPMLASLKHVGGAGGFINRLGLDRLHLYPVYTHVGQGKLLAMGDSHDEIDRQSYFAWFAGESRDPLMNWFWRLGPSDEWTSLFDDPSDAQAQSPRDAGLLPSRIFPDKGNAVLRTGWEDDAVVLNLRAGPHFNHNHFDQGSFRLWAGGRPLVEEAGFSSYYGDPYYWSFFIQAAGHNTILVDDNPESQFAGDHAVGPAAFNRCARIERSLADASLSWATAELSPVYRAPMRRLTRRVIMLPAGTVVVRDEARSASGPHLYQWQLFPPEREMLKVDAANASASIASDTAALAVRVIEPTGAILIKRNTPIPIEEYADYPEKPLKPRAVLQVSHEQAVKDLDFLVVLAPSFPGHDAPAGITAVRDGNAGGVEIRTKDGTVERLLFPAGEQIKTAGLLTDAAMVYRRVQNGKTSVLAVEAATRLELDGVAAIESGQPLDILIEMSSSGAASRWVIMARQAGTARLWPGTKRARTMQLVPGRNEFGQDRYFL